MKTIDEITAKEIVENKIHPINPRDRIIATRKVCQSGLETIKTLLEQWELEDNKKPWWKFW